MFFLSDVRIYVIQVDSDSDAPVYRKLITVGTADQCCTQARPFWHDLVLARSSVGHDLVSARFSVGTD